MQIQRKFPEFIKPVVDVHEDYGFYRSFRRGSNSEAINRGVLETVKDRNNKGSICKKKLEIFCKKYSKHRADFIW